MGWEFAEPFSAQPTAEDMGEQEGPALLGGPSLRDGVEPMQGVAHGGDSLREEVAIFVLEAHFDGALAAVCGQPRDAVEQRGPAGDGFAVMVAVIEPRVEVPPVVEERDEVGHEPAGGQLVRRIAAPAPLVLEFVKAVLPAFV